MSHKSDELKKLQAEWYQKLKDEGFEDAEIDENNLKQWDSQYFINRFTNFKGQRDKTGEPLRLDTTDFVSQQEYYRLAGILLHEYAFKDAVERRIWELHSSGVSNAKIFKKLKEEGTHFYRDGIAKVVKALATHMGVFYGGKK